MEFCLRDAPLKDETMKVIEFARAERIFKIIQQMDDLTPTQHKLVIKKLQKLKEDSRRVSASERRKRLLEIGGLVRFFKMGNQESSPHDSDKR